MKKQITFTFFQLISASKVLYQYRYSAFQNDDFKKDLLLFFANEDALSKINRAITKLEFTHKKTTKISFRLNELEAIERIFLKNPINQDLQLLLNNINQSKS